MALTIISSDTISAGTNTTISTADTDLHLLQGVLLASTGATGIQISEGDVNIRIDGTVSAFSSAINGGDNADPVSLTIGKTGSITSFQSASASAGVYIYGTSDKFLSNHGQISVPEAIAVITLGTTEALNTGSINGVTGLQFNFGGGSRLTNFGEITASAPYDDTQDIWEGRGVLIQTTDFSLFNGAGGRITSMVDDGNAIRAGFGGTNARIENHGEMALVGSGTAISFADTNSGTTVLINSGTISGETAYSGSAGVDAITNSGSINGDVDLNAGDDTYTGVGTGQVSGVVNGGSGDDTLVGGELGDTLDGGQDADIIRGRGGDDSLTGGGGGNQVFGGDGNDTLDGGSLAVETLDGGAGDDLIRGLNALQTTLRGGSGNDTLVGGGSAVITFDAGSGDDLILHLKIDSGGVQVLGGQGDDTIVLSGDGNTVRAGSGNDSVTGDGAFHNYHLGKGDDYLDFQGLTSTLSGGSGDDEIRLGMNSQNNTVIGGLGNDTLRSSDEANMLDGGGDDDILLSFGGNDTLKGGRGNDTLIAGNKGDLMYGGRDDDLMEGEAGNDTMHGGIGEDTMDGGANKDRMFGGDGSDVLDGGSSADVLIGGAGNDTLIGGTGPDTLAGGGGADVFVFTSPSDTGDSAGTRDKIEDFRTGTDLLDLVGMGMLEFTASGSPIGGGLASVWLRVVSGNTLVRFDFEGDGNRDAQIELVGTTGVTESDLILA